MQNAQVMEPDDAYMSPAVRSRTYMSPRMDKKLPIPYTDNELIALGIEQKS